MTEVINHTGRYKNIYDMPFAVHFAIKPMSEPPVITNLNVPEPMRAQFIMMDSWWHHWGARCATLPGADRHCVMYAQSVDLAMTYISILVDLYSLPAMRMGSLQTPMDLLGARAIITDADEYDKNVLVIADN